MKYRKRPIVVSAEVYRPGLEDDIECTAVFCPEYTSGDCYKCPNGMPYIQTLEGRMYISPGDYIITGVKGERYPCKPDVFHMTYEEVTNEKKD